MTSTSKANNEETSGLLVASDGRVVGRSGQGTEIDHSGLRFLVAIGVGQAPFSGGTPVFNYRAYPMGGCSSLDGLVGAQVIGQGGHTVTFVGDHNLLGIF